MPLLDLTVHNFRLYKQSTIAADPEINLITGANASGKTTLLEAIHTLSTGRSFRATPTAQLARNGERTWWVRGSVGESSEQERMALAISCSNDGSRQIAVGPNTGGKPTDLAHHLPLLVISPDTHFDFQRHAKTRRSVLDWLLFHVEPDYHQVWVRYQRALQQRNAALKFHKYAESRFAWDEELATLGDVIQAKREAQLEQLRADFCAIVDGLFGRDLASDLILLPGWERARGMAAGLRADRARDLARGFTHSGPHRNDLDIRIADQSSQDQASHGQNKLLVIALRLTQIQKLHTLTNKRCCLLVDDLPAELDAERRGRLSDYLSRSGVQVFVTATDPSLVDTKAWASFRRFHVEHGGVEQVD